MSDSNDFKRCPPQSRQVEETEEETIVKRPPKTRVDADGTEYEWDDNAKGYFPKLSDESLAKHHINYGLGDGEMEFDQQIKCYVYRDAKSGLKMKFELESNQWIPFDAKVIAATDDKPLSYIDPTTQITFELHDKLWQPTVSSFVDDRNGSAYIWIREQKTFVPAQLVQEYTDHLSGLSFRLKDGEWKEVDKAKEATNKPEWFEMPDEKNCNVYVSGLGVDVSDEEFRLMMSKYGLIAPDPETNKPKLKLYKESDGRPKGDGLCTFLKVESVELCLKLLDGMRLVDGREIRAERAKFQMKGEYNPGLKRKQNKSKKDKAKMAKVSERLLGWSGDEQKRRPKHERIIVIKNLYDPNEDRLVLGEIKERVRSMVECYGHVHEVRSHPNNPSGVMTVALSDPETADRCVSQIHNRLWKGKVLECFCWDGKTKFDEESREQDEARIEKWHEFIESEQQ